MIIEENLMIEITDEPLNLAKLCQFVSHASCGAINIFLGTVRNHAEGRKVSGIEYHGYPEMAEKILLEITGRVFEKWNVHKIAVQQRLGMLRLKETSIIIAVAAPHREETFAACKFIIEEVKQKLPVWKKEHFGDGSQEWKNIKPGSG